MIHTQDTQNNDNRTSEFLSHRYVCTD